MNTFSFSYSSILFLFISVYFRVILYLHPFTSVSISVYSQLPMCISLRLFFCFSLQLFLFSLFISVYLSVYLYICLLVCIHLPAYLYLCLFIRVSLCQFIFILLSLLGYLCLFICVCPLIYCVQMHHPWFGVSISTFILYEKIIFIIIYLLARVRPSTRTIVKTEKEFQKGMKEMTKRNL